MTTGQVFPNFTTQRVVGLQDLKDNFLDFLREAIRSNHATIYDEDGTYGATKLTLAADGPDKFKITGSARTSDGQGHVLDVAQSQHVAGVQFQNALGVDYWVSLTHALRPSGVQVNPRTGLPEYVNQKETIGLSGAPDIVTDNGPNITLRVDSVTEAGVSCAGRKVLVYRQSIAKYATTEAVAVEELTVAWTGANNEVTTSGLLGQTVVSTTPADYVVLLLGPVVRRNTDPRPVVGHDVLGYVTGAGAGNAPSTFSTLDQLLFSATLANINHVTRKDSHGFLKVSVQADASDVGESQIEVKDALGNVKFTIDEAGNMIFGGDVVPIADLNGQNVGRGTPLRWTKGYFGDLFVWNNGPATLEFHDDTGTPDARKFLFKQNAGLLSIASSSDDYLTQYAFLTFWHFGGAPGLIIFNTDSSPYSTNSYSLGNTGAQFEYVRSHYHESEDAAVGISTTGRKWYTTNSSGLFNFVATTNAYGGSVVAARVAGGSVGSVVAGVHAGVDGSDDLGNLAGTAYRWRNLRLTGTSFLSLTSEGLNQKTWGINIAAGGTIGLATYTDAEAVTGFAWQVRRTGTTVLGFDVFATTTIDSPNSNILKLRNTDAGITADQSRWRLDIANSSGNLELKTSNDAEAAFITFLRFTRTGTSPTGMYVNSSIFKFISGGAYDVGAAGAEFVNVFGTTVHASGTSPGLRFYNQGGTADRRRWRLDFVGDDLALRLFNDAEGSFAVAAQFTRSGTTTVSQATWAMSHIPSSSIAYDVGNSGAAWRDVFLGRTLNLTGPGSWMDFSNTSAPANARWWNIGPQTADGSMSWRTVSDAGVLGDYALRLMRTTTTADFVRMCAHLQPGASSGAASDNAIDVGAPSTRFRSGYFGTDVQVDNHLTWTGGHHGEWKKEGAGGTTTIGTTYTEMDFDTEKGTAGTGDTGNPRGITRVNTPAGTGTGYQVSRSGLYLISYSVGWDPGNPTGSFDIYAHAAVYAGGVGTPAVIEGSRSKGHFLDTNSATLGDQMLQSTFVVQLSANDVVVVRARGASAWTTTSGIVEEATNKITIVELSTAP